ncbi:MAG: DivIVA domain-containing protein [Clostridia bacterium]|nr:DivIVA domain-containing protein [Clostridia bacterium]
MMTPSELKQYEFKTAGRNAYKADDVDSFFGEVLVNYEKMFRENSELIKRVSLLADRLENYKKDEVDIKQAVLSAQKAADIIVRDAEESVADAKQEAEAILAAAKGEADIIKSDAEKQAIADSDLLLSIARDKAEEIMNKAKEKAHGILIAANDSASNTVGAATRTITSESIHYDMLKKEVSEFRASILAQYKAHIELISKLPELAVEEASKIEDTPVENPVSVENIVDELVAEEVEKTEEVFEEENDVLEFVEDVNELEISVETETEVDAEESSCENSEDNNEVVDELPGFSDEVETVSEDEENAAEEPADIPISKGFSINSVDFDFGGFDDETEEIPEETLIPQVDESVSESIDVQENFSAPVEVDDNNDDIFDDDNDDSVASFFDSIESIDTDEDKDEPKKQKRGFFRKWK